MPLSSDSQENLNSTSIEINCSGTDEVVCPHCGYEFSDSWDFGFNGREMDIQCGNPECEKVFSCEPDYSVVYYSRKKKQP